MARADSLRRTANFKKGIYLLPNLCTTASLFCGFYSVVKSLAGDFHRAGWAILIAGLFDFLDGRIARVTKSHSRFGVEYDSLVDLASFGFAPSILVYTWTLHQFQRFGWLAAFLFFACGALRLARFNVQTGVVEKKYFHGLPIPAAAYTLVGMVLFYQYLYDDVAVKNWFYPALTVLLALLMVSNIRYQSFKDIDWRSRQSFYYLVVALAVFVLVSLAPDIVIFAGGCLYAVSGPIQSAFDLKKRLTGLPVSHSSVAGRRFQSKRLKVIPFESTDLKQPSNE